MSLLIEFKKALDKAINDFSQQEGNLTEIQAQAVIDIKRLVDTIDSAVSLRLEINIKLGEVPRKTFSFLPFVNDLSTKIRKVLDDSSFAENQLLIADYCDIRVVNKELREENTLLRQEFEAFKKSGLPQEIAATLQNLNKENSRLSEELSQSEQALKLAVSEKEILEHSVIVLTQGKQIVEEELKKTQEEKEELAKDNLQKLDENIQLKEENKRLKAELEAYKRNNVIDNTKQDKGVDSSKQGTVKQDMARHDTTKHDTAKQNHSPHLAFLRFS